MYAIQGAMAVRRERNKRKARRLSQLRRGSQSGSLYSVVLDDEEEERLPPKTSSSLTAFHIGVIFILLGFIMIFSSLIGTNNMSDYEYAEEERIQHKSEWSKLLGVGVTCIIVGLLMVMVNRIITAREEEELEEYVKRRLARTRSGHALVRDAEAYPRRLSTHPGVLPTGQQQLLPPHSMSRRGSTVASTRSPRGKAPRLEGGPRRGNGSMREVERTGSFYSQVPRSSTSVVRQSIKEPRRTSSSIHHLPSVTTEQEVHTSHSTEKLNSVPSPSVSNELPQSDEISPSQGDKFMSSRRKRRQD